MQFRYYYVYLLLILFTLNNIFKLIQLFTISDSIGKMNQKVDQSYAEFLWSAFVLNKLNNIFKLQNIHNLMIIFRIRSEKITQTSTKRTH